MKISQKYLMTGKLPYNNLKLVTAMEAKLFSKCPFLAYLPQMGDNEIELRTLKNIPGIIYRDDKLVLRTGTEEYQKAIADLDKAFSDPTAQNLDLYAFDSVFLEKFGQMITKFKPKNACVNFLGPFTISQKLLDSAKEQTITDKKFRKLFVEAVGVKALWIIDRIKSLCPDTVPIIILEEPLLGQFGMVKRENEEITADVVIGMLEKVTDKLKAKGAIVGVQCMDKCDWSIPIRAGVDLISYDAYNNPNNLCIIPEIITSFLKNGGFINWAIVPVSNEALVKSLTIDYLRKRLSTTMGGVALAGVPANLLKKSATVSINGDSNHLPILFAEKAVILASHLGAKLN